MYKYEVWAITLLANQPGWFDHQDTYDNAEEAITEKKRLEAINNDEYRAYLVEVNGYEENL